MRRQMKGWEKRAIFWLVTVGLLALSQWSMALELNRLRDRVEHLEIQRMTTEGGDYGNLVP